MAHRRYCLHCQYATVAAAAPLLYALFFRVLAQGALMYVVAAFRYDAAMTP